jgi:hypothetical protein
MISIQLLEENDQVLPSDWCRPLQIVSMNGGHSDYYSFESCYSGLPENNAKWCRVDQVFGQHLFYNSVKEFNECNLTYEFVRGPIPFLHQYGKTKPEIREEYVQYLANTNIAFGKYKGKSFAWIKQNDNSYFEWAKHQNIIKTSEDF